MASAWRKQISRKQRDRDVAKRRHQYEEARPVLQLPVAEPPFEVEAPRSAPAKVTDRGVGVVDFYI